MLLGNHSGRGASYLINHQFLPNLQFIHNEVSIKILAAIAWIKQNNHLLQQANAKVESRNLATSKME